MDKNKLIGLGLIGFLLVAIGILNKKEANTDIKSKATPKTEVQSNKPKAITKNTDNKAKPTAQYVQNFKDTIVKLETNKSIYSFSTKGGMLSSVELKSYRTYDNYIADKKVPLKLFDKGDDVNELVFKINGKDYTTGNKPFEIVEQTPTKLVFQNTLAENKYIQFIYTVKKDAYDMDFDIRLKGFGGEVAPNSIMLSWKTDYLKTEQLLRNQQMVSTTVFQYTDGKHDWLSEGSDNGKKDFDKGISWIAHKQSYFSSIMKPSSAFSQEGMKLHINKFGEGSKKEFTYVKHYTSLLNLGIENTADANVHINWFFGPNELHLLKSYNSDYENILNLGWGLFRWINLYVFDPLFMMLASTGLSYGLVILFMTLIIKFVLMPIQWKMYVSSAKMRILKPEIDELGVKYPNKEDALKKQTEMMTLYKESGASPLSGCLPALIQAPILFAVFRYFPASFELRQQSFLWAKDLSSYDSIYTFGTYIPMYGDHISLFTLLMSATTLIYTWYNSANMTQPTQPGMPNMKVIMYIMPIMMIFFFNNYSSGLSYYYFISTLASIVIMLLIKQFFVDEEKLKAKMIAKKVESKKNGGKKKSKFQERLEAMQKLQQEQQKNKRK